jgi:hypothetical protein
MSTSINPVLKTIMEMSGIKLVVNRDSEIINEIVGLKNQDPNNGSKYIALYPGVDVAAGDLLVAVKSQEEFFIIATEHEYVEGQWFQERAYYGSKQEYTYSQVSGSPSELPDAIDQPDLTTDYLSYLDSLIKIKSSGLEQDFATLLAEVEKILSGNEISRGCLTEYSELLQENEWLATAIGTILVSWISR